MYIERGCKNISAMSILVQRYNTWDQCKYIIQEWKDTIQGCKTPYRCKYVIYDKKYIIWGAKMYYMSARVGHNREIQG